MWTCVCVWAIIEDTRTYILAPPHSYIPIERHGSALHVQFCLQLCFDLTLHATGFYPLRCVDEPLPLQHTVLRVCTGGKGVGGGNV
jgi:hypothetical protein